MRIIAYDEKRQTQRLPAVCLPYLFTYQRPDCQGMPNTNNRIEGVFTDLKKSLNNHCGMSETNRKRFVLGFFKASRKL